MKPDIVQNSVMALQDHCSYKAPSTNTVFVDDVHLSDNFQCFACFRLSFSEIQPKANLGSADHAEASLTTNSKVVPQVKHCGCMAIARFVLGKAVLFF